MPCMGRYAVHPLAFQTRLRLLCHRPPMGFPEKPKRSADTPGDPYRREEARALSASTSPKHGRRG
jgi:hypothetical protein